METQSLQAVSAPHDYRANVDTSRPFRSVKEAVAILGERLLLGEFFSSPSPKLPCYTKQERETLSPWNNNSMTSSPSPSTNTTSANKESDDDHVLDSLKKLEAELEETKKELKLLKARESETEVALANLNAELHKNMSKFAQAEAATAASAAASSDQRVVSSTRSNLDEEAEKINAKKDSWSMIRMENLSTSLAQILSIGSEHEKQYGYFGSDGKRDKSNKMMKKKKPIVPLLHELFSGKKGSSSSTPLHNHIYSSPQLYY